jgi:ketosteroid isomerase-like protein
VFNNQQLVNRLLAKISEAEKATLADLISERIEQEPAVTDRLLGVMQYLLNHHLWC